MYGSPATASGLSPAEASRRYTIEEISKRSRLSPRTIRFYQTEGTLHPPEHRGRVAYYDDTHLDRLRLIVELKSRGLTLSAIQALIRESEGQGLSVEDWLRGGGGRHRAAEASAGPPSYQRWVKRETGPEPISSLPAPVEAPGVEAPGDAVSPASPASLPWAGLAWAGTALVVVVSWGLLVVLTLNLRDANTERERLRRDVVALQHQVSRSQPGLPPLTTTPTFAPPPPPATGPPSASSAAEPPAAPSPETSGASGDEPAALPPPPPPTPPVTTTTTNPPCTVLPIIRRCL